MTDAAAEAKQYLSLVDLTSLNLDDDEAKIRSLCEKAINGPCCTAAVCVYPQWVKLAKECLKSHPEVSVATVINFPEGTKAFTECEEDIAKAKSDEVDDIDFVIDWRRFKTDQSFLKEYVEGMVRLSQPCVTKAILETSELTADEIRSAAKICIEAGVSFLKTSTGKVKSGGATVEAVTIFAEEIKKSGRVVGVKPSGGIKNLQDCAALWKAVTDILGSENYRSKAHFRFGASGVRDQLISVINSSASQSSASGLKEVTQTSETVVSTEAVSSSGAENY